MKRDRDAFSRADLLCCIFALTLLFAVAASLLASNKSESQRIVCFNNLRQIGRGFHIWGSDYQDQMPWQVPYGLGGTGPGLGGPPGGLAVNAFWHFSWISNQLESPKILVCPADAGKKIASNWSLSAAGGFLNPSYGPNALSYALFLHALPNNPVSGLSGDRNFVADHPNASCSFVPSAVCVEFDTRVGGGGLAVGAWSNAVHGLVGHLLFMDGSVAFTTTTEFRQAVYPPILSRPFYHGLKP